MRIILSPQVRGDTLRVSKAGDVLTINGDAYDFSSLPEGGELPLGTVPCEWIAGPVRREAGEIELTLLLPIGADPGPATAWPEPLEDVPDGAVAFPQDPAPEEPVNVEP